MPKLRVAWQLSEKNHDQTFREISALALDTANDRKAELVEVQKKKLLAAGELSRRKRSNPFLNRLADEADAAVADLIPRSNLFKLLNRAAKMRLAVG